MPRLAVARSTHWIFGALFYYWQQADSFWKYVWAIFPKAVLWPAVMVYEGFRALGA